MTDVSSGTDAIFKWLFEGVGGAALVAILAWFLKRKKKAAPVASSPTISDGARVQDSLVGTQNLGNGITAHTININPPAAPTASDGPAPPDPELRSIGRKAWELFQIALGRAASLTSVSQHRPDFRFKIRTDEEARRVLRSHEFSDELIEEVLCHSDPSARSAAFTLIEDRRRFQQTVEDLHQFMNYVIINEPLLPNSVYAALVAKGKELELSLISLEIALESPEATSLEKGRHDSDLKVRSILAVGTKELKRELRPILGVRDAEN